MMHIGGVNIDGKAVLAPLAGVSDIPFRLLCRKCGASLVFSEMISAEGIVRGSQKTLRYVTFTLAERPIAIQLFGGNPETLGEAAALIENCQPDIIDVNFGCPIRKVIRAEAGSALLKNPALMGRIIEKMVTSVHIPITAKIRSGWDESSMPAADIARILENSGISAITIHARTSRMKFSGKAQWSDIRSVKEAVSVPVIGNGDIVTPVDAKRMLDETGCDIVMVGRGALGNPWIFHTINHYLRSGELLPMPSFKEKIDMCLKQYMLAYEIYGEGYTINTMKKHIGWYLKGIPGSIPVKTQIFNSRGHTAIIELLSELSKRVSNEVLYTNQNYA